MGEAAGIGDKEDFSRCGPLVLMIYFLWNSRKPGVLILKFRKAVGDPAVYKCSGFLVFC